MAKLSAGGYEGERTLLDRGNIRIGKLFGIPISINYSWIIIFLLITWALIFQFRFQVPRLSLATHVIMGLAASLLFFSSVVFHEMVHSLIARRYGVPIAAINLWVFGGMAQMTDEPGSPGVEFLMSISGPLSSIFLGGFFGLIYLATRGVSVVIAAPAAWLAYINVLLGIFNLLPGFPLDGGRVLRSIVWYFTGNLTRATRVASLGGKAIAYLLIGGGFITLLLLGNIGGLWFILLGWVLLQAAESGYQQVIFRQTLQGTKVQDIMTEQPSTVGTDLTLEELVHDYFMRYRWGAFPVVEDGTVKGLVTLHDVREIARDLWPVRRVSDIMRPISEDIVARPQDDLTAILPKLEAKAEGRMLVLADARLVGILTRTDVSRFIQMRLDLGER